jgi:protein-S-isoprenylcysteine O-methyltransferase Ste14
MVFYIFYFTLSIEIALLVFVVNNAVKSVNDYWPPEAGNIRPLYVLMFIFYLIIAGSMWIGFRDRANPLFAVDWLRYIGIFLLALGIVLYTWCRMYISKKVEFGAKDQLIVQGPYQYTRNPVYIADTLIFSGLAIISNSLLVYILLFLLVTILLILPFIEEPWLLKQYGEQYKNYKSEVPRYL